MQSRPTSPAADHIHLSAAQSASSPVLVQLVHPSSSFDHTALASSPTGDVRSVPPACAGARCYSRRCLPIRHYRARLSFLGFLLNQFSGLRSCFDPPRLFGACLLVCVIAPPPPPPRCRSVLPVALGATTTPAGAVVWV
jgi:hypothetical protein